ncbi:MAG TPA: hypothetical protein VGM88_17185 [Kofleriaceae bacterium]
MIRPDESAVMEKSTAATITPPAPKPKVVAPIGREVLVGELCPKGAEGRPAIAPVALKTLSWTASNIDTTNAIERGSVPRFTAFGTDGKVAGLFDTMGLADLGPSAPSVVSVASGTYVGGSPCSSDGGAGQNRVADGACEAETHGCGLAVAALTRQDDTPVTPTYATGGACIWEKSLAVDIDGDGKLELFPLSGVLDGIHSPAQEWSAEPPDKAAGCAPKFALYGVPLSPEQDPKATVKLDVLGVVDLDGDGRRELVLALTFPAARSIVIYTAGETSTRLTLAGESPGFPR